MGRSSRKGWVHLLLKLLMKVKCCNPGNYCTAWTWHKKQHLIFPLYMYTLGRTESVWHLGSHGFPLCRFLRCMAWICLPSPSLPPALGKYSGQAVANTLSSPWWGHDYCRVGECPEKKTCLSANIGDKGSSEFCTGTCPKAFLWSFNLLWHGSPFPQRSKRGLCGHLTVRKKCCWWLC